MPLDLLALPARDALRQAIDATTRRAEPDCVAALLGPATLDPERERRARALAERLIVQLRAARSRAGGVDALIQTFSLS